LQPTILMPSILTLHLHSTISLHLSNLGHREHALEVIQEAVDLYRQLAADRPHVFNPNLAGSLSTLSNRLSDLGHQERALEVIQEEAEYDIRGDSGSATREPPSGKSDKNLVAFADLCS